MNHNHHTPQPAPSALCRAYAPLLPLLSLDALDQEEATAVARHVHSCDYCQRELADYRDLRAALRREDAREAEDVVTAQVLTLVEVRRAAEREEGEPLIFEGPAPWRERPASVLSRRWRATRVIEVVAAVLVIALLAGLLTGHGGLGRNSARTPKLDAASQRYVTMLWIYYVPLVDANNKAQRCLAAVFNSDPPGRAQLMATCQPLETNELAAAQTFSAQLNVATPPMRWRAQHAALQQAESELMAVTNEQVAATTARDVTRYLGTINPALTAQSRFEDPITQLNLQLHAGASPRPQPLPYLSSDYSPHGAHP